jgi:hypothetical protein
MTEIDRNVLPLLTVLNGIFSTQEPSDLLETVLQAAVHGWMEGHLGAPGHHVSSGPTEEMPSPPFPPRDPDALGTIVGEAMDRFSVDEAPAAALYAGALGWQAGRQAGLDCPGCTLENADQPIPRAIRAGRGQYRFHLQPADRGARLATERARLGAPSLPGTPARTARKT